MMIRQRIFLFVRVLLLLLMQSLFACVLSLTQDEIPPPPPPLRGIIPTSTTTGDHDPALIPPPPPRHQHESATLLEDDSIQYDTKTGELRRLQADSFFPDDDPYWNPNGIMERKPCIDFALIRNDQITNPNADGECATNTCGGGCCRAYNWLLCDTDSSFAYVSCVCNSETWPADQWTKAPTVPRPTSPTPPPTLAPVTPAPVTPAPSPPPPTAAPVLNANTATPTALDLCPSRVRTTCATVDTGIDCQNIPIPSDLASPECNATVVYTYNITNLGTEPRLIYALTVLRDNSLTIVTNLAEVVPTIILQPGESYITPGFHQSNDICLAKGVDVFDAKVDVTDGPLIPSLETVTCVTDEGGICDDLVQTTTDCFLNVTYTYTIENVATVPYDIVLLNVTRGNEPTRDLVYILEQANNTRVEVGGSVSVQEVEEINRCDDPLPSFATDVTVRKIPPLNELCVDTYYYPYGMIPEQYI